MPLELLAAQGSLWVLTCDRGCTGEARNSMGRIVRIDPRSGRVAASATLRRPGRIAVGASGVYATDFWRDRIRRIDLRTLQVVGSLQLRLPFRFTARDNAFVPLAVAVGHAVWVATERGALARTDLQLRNVVATVRLPFDAFQGITVGPGAVWLAESLAGVYRIDPRTNHVSARIRIPLAAGSLDAEQIVLSGGKVLAIGAKTSADTLTGQNGVARIDPQHNRVEAVTPLPSGPLLAVTVGQGSLWVARVGGSSVERVDPRTGKVVARIRGQIGTALAVAGGYLWTASREGTIRKLKKL
jgi:streptogramin lyase